MDLGANLSEPQEELRPTIVLPPRDENETNRRPRAPRPPAEAEAGTAGQPGAGPPPEPSPGRDERVERRGPPPEGAERADRGDRRRRFGRPPWMSEAEFNDLLQRRGLHGLIITMSTDSYHRAALHDLWLRCIICGFAGISAFGMGLAWRNIGKSAQLQMRLLRASELNTHLKEMNIAAAGLAHETRNPLNIIRGQAQLISRRPDTTPEIRQKLGHIIDETDRVTAQLNEFISYSRPREPRPAPVQVTQVVREVARTLDCDLEEKQVELEVNEDGLVIDADEPLLRQALFNLLLNAIQAVAPQQGKIQVVTGRTTPEEAFLEIRDNGPGVPPQHQLQIFKPYFTTHQEGTGLGLAVVHQIVLAHGWEIHYHPNQPVGAIFRINHLKLNSKSLDHAAGPQPLATPAYSDRR
jgi:signal transduction histidine kinase